MTSQMTSVSALLMSKVEMLLPEKQQQLLVFAEFLLYQQAQAEGQAYSTEQAILDEGASPPNQVFLQQRIFGQYQGQIWMSEDFDAPLPDEFWLRES